MNKISKRSIDNLKGIDPRLAVIIGMALARGNVDFTITEGLRTKERQYKLVQEGKSKTMNSKHLTGKAVDFIPYPFHGWNDTESFRAVGEELKRIAEFLGYKCQYGGDWKSFKDFPHFQLDY